jgi:hypothetical protein
MVCALTDSHPSLSRPGKRDVEPGAAASSASKPMEKFMAKETKIGRDARNGQFIPVAVAIKRPSTTIVQTIKKGK